jgi:pimeloyl-ACP methyl ester carboxylesterase
VSGGKDGATVRRYVGLAAAATGVAVAGTVTGALTRRRHGSPVAPVTDTPLGAIRGDSRPVMTSDGLALHAEVDEPAFRESASDVTVVLVHGYALSLDSWHFQRLAATHRVVLYDQRSHGRSERAPAGASTMDHLGDDLAAVIEALAPTGRLVLVGHSMGGMTILSLADRRPDLFAERVAGVCLVSTCARGLGTLSLGLPPALARTLNGVSPAVLGALARAPRLVARGRRVGSAYAAAIVGRLGFGAAVPPEVSAFANEMLTATPIEVIAEFYPEFSRYDRSDVLRRPGWPPTTVVCGDRDLITPVELSRALAAEIRGARLVEVAGAGHLVLLERPDIVAAEIARLVESADSVPPDSVPAAPTASGRHRHLS